MYKFKYSILAVCLLMALTLAACSGGGSKETSTTAKKQPKSLIEVANGETELSTLVSLVNQAGLDALLKLQGSFTIFAPNNEAFDKFGLDNVEAIKANPDMLKAVLTYHAVSSKVMMAADFKDGKKIQTVNGAMLTVGRDGDKITLTTDSGDKFNIVKSDIGASNGIVHIVDGVLIPENVKEAQKQ